MRRSFTAAIVVVAIAAVIAPMPGQAQSDYPNRVVKIVVPYGAGSAPDILVRALAPGLSGRLGQQFIVENKAGGSGALGTASVARAEADGYTLLFAPAVVLSVLPQARNADAGYKPDSLCRSVRPSSTPWGLRCGRNRRSRASADLVAAAKQKPGALNYGHPGVLTIPQLAVEEFQQAAGIDIKDIPFRSGPQIAHRAARRTARCAFRMVMGTEVGQNIRVIGVFSEKRIATFPDVPTVKEQGYEVTPASFGGLLAPLGTPAADLVQAVVGLRRSRKGRYVCDDRQARRAARRLLRRCRGVPAAPRARHRQQGARAVASQDTIKKNPGARPGFSTTTYSRGSLLRRPVSGSTCGSAFGGAAWYWTALDACCTGASIKPLCCGATTGGLIAASLVQRSLKSTRPSCVYSLLKQVHGPATRVAVAP